MPTTMTLAVMASLFLPVQAVKQPPTAPPHKYNAVLCETEAQAVALARTVAAGKTETIAVNLVNKAAGAEVCGRYIGYAAVEVEKTTNDHGGLFMLAGLRFAEDAALAWTASWVAPFEGANLERGA
jgi:hypothetical protein